LSVAAAAGNGPAVEVLLNTSASLAAEISAPPSSSTSLHPFFFPIGISSLYPASLNSHRDRLAGNTLWKLKAPHTTHCGMHGIGVSFPYSSHLYSAPLDNYHYTALPAPQTQPPTHPTDLFSPALHSPHPPEVNVALLLQRMQDRALRRQELARRRFESLALMGDLELDAESDLNAVTPKVLQNILLLIR
jgi:hypothetical protein